MYRVAEQQDTTLDRVGLISTSTNTYTVKLYQAFQFTQYSK